MCGGGGVKAVMFVTVEETPVHFAVDWRVTTRVCGLTWCFLAKHSLGEHFL